MIPPRALLQPATDEGTKQCRPPFWSDNTASLPKGFPATPLVLPLDERNGLIDLLDGVVVGMGCYSTLGAFQLLSWMFLSNVLSVSPTDLWFISTLLHSLLRCCGALDGVLSQVIERIVQR